MTDNVSTTKVHKNLSLQDLPNEIWKDIPDYEGLYQASNLGRIKSLKRIIQRKTGTMPVKEKIISQHVPQRYLTISLSKDGNRRAYQTHQIIAITFKGHVPDGFKLVVDHIDNNRLNNHIDNLQIITNRENASKNKTGYTSKYIGVHWRESRKKWRASIYYNGKNIELGEFSDEKEASEYYKNALKSIEDGTEIISKRRVPVSSVKGITYRKDTDKWQVRVLVDGKRKSLGSYDTEEKEIEILNNYKNQ